VTEPSNDSKKTVTTVAFRGDNNAVKQFSAREYYYIFPINPVRPSGRWLTTPKRFAHVFPHPSTSSRFCSNQVLLAETAIKVDPLLLASIHIH
jgi:hypothetical protein